MAGTDNGKRNAMSGPQPVMVLVKPQMGENIGASARAMWNFGLDRMRLVAPRDGWPNPKAEAMSSGAGRLLDEATVHDTTADAIADLEYVFATTARDRDLTKEVFTPDEAMKKTRDMIANGQKVGFLFGPERSGLESADVVRANAVVSVPVNPAFGSLNLAQCVLLLAYEWGQDVVPQPDEEFRMSAGELAPSADVGRFVDTLVERLDKVGFFYPENKRDSMIANLENLFRRAPLTPPDIRILHGVTRALAEKVRGRK